MNQTNYNKGILLIGAKSKRLTTSLIIIMLFVLSGSIKSQSNLLGVDPFVNALYSYTPGIGPWSLQSTTSLTMSGFIIQGANSISYNPQNGLYYIVLKVSAGGGRRLATVNPTTGVCTLVGNLGDNFSSITFTPIGKLYGITGTSQNGAGAINPRTLYEINPVNATKVFKQTLTNGADGQVIAFNPDDGFIYHWSGNNSTVTEKVDTTIFSVTNIVESGLGHREVFGAAYFKSGAFFVADIDFNVFSMSSSGQYTSMGFTSVLFRGLAYSLYPRCVYSSLPYVSASSTAICSGGSVNIAVDSGNLYEANNWQWYSGSCCGTMMSAGNSLTVSTSVTTTYYAKGEGGCVGSTPCSSVTIAVGPPAAPSAISGPSAICQLTSTSYSVASVVGATTYTWTVPIGVTGMTITSGQGTNTITVNISAGTVIGNVTCTTSNGCGTGGTATLAVTKKPAVPGAIAGPDDVCGLNVANYSITPVFGAISYSWSVSGGMTITSGNGTPTITVNVPSSFATGLVKVIAVNACGSVPGISLTINGNSTPASVIGPTNVCGMTTAVYSTPAITNASSYQWVVPGYWTITGQGTNTITATLPANVNNITYSGTVKVAAVRACGTSTFKTLFVSYCKANSSINGEEPANDYVYSLFPNPATDQLQITNHQLQISGLMIYNVVGQLVLQSAIGNEQTTISISSLTKGLYFVRLMGLNGHVISIERLIKE